MKSITVAELRQNPTQALTDVEAGEVYVVTRHRREIARLVPPSEQVDVVQAKAEAGARLHDRPRHQLRTATTVDELLQDLASDW